MSRIQYPKAGNLLNKWRETSGSVISLITITYLFGTKVTLLLISDLITQGKLMFM